MKTLQTIGIAAAILCLFAIATSEAQIEIIDMYTPTETYTGLFYPYAYVDTDKPYDVIDWRIYSDPDDISSARYITGTIGDGVATRAYFYPDEADCPGHIKGKKYRVSAKVWYYDEDGSSWSDYEYGDFTVFASKFTAEVQTPPKRLRSIYGYSELTRQYYTGDAIKIDCYVSASNPHETDRRAWSRFKHSLTGRNTIERDHPIGFQGILPQRIGGEYGSYSHSDTLAHYNINLLNDSYTSGAYVRLVVQGGGGEDHYFVENSETFDSDDEPYDAPDNE